MKSSSISRRGLIVGAWGALGALLSLPSLAHAAQMPEDILKGKLIVSTESLPTKWTSAAQFAARLKSLHKSSVTYDKKTGKVEIYYAGFFAQPVPDVQVNFVIYDITDKSAGKAKKGAWEAFLGRKGDRVIFNRVELDKEDLEMNKKYLLAIEFRGRIIAQSELIIRGEGPKYSGKVEFSEEEAQKKE